MQFIILRIFVVGFLACSSGVSPVHVQTPEQRHKTLQVIARLQADEPGRIDVFTTSKGPTEFRGVYSELEPNEPAASLGKQFTVTFRWNKSLGELLPSAVDDGIVLPVARPLALFFCEGCDVPVKPITHREITLDTESSAVQLVIDAAVVSGTHLPVPLQSLVISTDSNPSSIILEKEIQNVYFLNAKLADVDGDGEPEILLALAAYKTRIVYVLGNRDKKAPPTLIPSFSSGRQAREFGNGLDHQKSE